MTRHWLWLDATKLYAVHDEQLVEHGGISGVRDIGMFESALSRSPLLHVLHLIATNEGNRIFL
ncbi:MAG: hypothetical protein U1C89_03365 [Methylotenera sp.]|nr:hypothetical protein [Methylotenera sp.]